ncbi:iron donor protein CyaY [Microbulbifer sp. GL-2]|uniref:iron donor protein CyaY n=1 Tax=Microbulbifer sp. GL-2 TaxID=2591606 RepID=UPI001164EFA2|nr:iron donor protein CyaY [Microbulbifer sp. GL-2]BBM01085.1 protein CyaY [Microbulbifer sp. GL-2]
MSQTEYEAAIEQSLMAIEDALDECDWDIDYERSGSVLTLTLEDNGSQVILSRQSANRELWVAAKSGGYHLAFQSPGWKCGTTGEDLPTLLDRVLSEQQGEAVSLEIDQ